MPRTDPTARQRRPSRWLARLAGGAALAAILPRPGAADAVPEHLASLGAAIYRHLDASLGDDQPQAGTSREALAWARETLRHAGVQRWSDAPVRLHAGAEHLAQVPPDAPEDVRAEALRSAWTVLAESLESRHELSPSAGERVEVGWLPELGRSYLKVSADGEDGSPEYEVLLRSAVAASRDPATGDLVLSAAPTGDAPAVLTEGELRLVRASILGTWHDGDTLYRFTASDARGGGIRADPSALDDVLRGLHDRIQTLREAKVYVWRNADTGRLERQDRFRRLEEPYQYVGEEYAETDAEARIAELEEDVAALEAERDEASPVGRHDPAGIEEALRSVDSLPVEVSVLRPDGYAYRFDEAKFDGRRLVARRTYRDVRDADNVSLPGAVRRQLVTEWSPQSWLDLRATLDPATGSVSVAGSLWSQKVTYSSGALGTGEPKVESVHSPHPKPLRLHRPGVERHVAEAGRLDAPP